MSRPQLLVNPSAMSLARSLAEALDAAYVSGKSPPYRVPYRMAGDLFLFASAKTRVQAIETIRAAADRAVSLVVLESARPEIKP
jgi:hypothetical protein